MDQSSLGLFGCGLAGLLVVERRWEQLPDLCFSDKSLSLSWTTGYAARFPAL